MWIWKKVYITTWCAKLKVCELGENEWTHGLNYKVIKLINELLLTRCLHPLICLCAMLSLCLILLTYFWNGKFLIPGLILTKLTYFEIQDALNKEFQEKSVFHDY